MPKALGHAAIRTGYDVLFTTQSKMLNQLQAARATKGYDRHFAKLAALENSYLANLKKVCPFIG
jgi:DNA replication protein DnaC